MLALRTSTSLSALGLVLGIAGTSWLTALTYERAPATRPFAEIVMPGMGKLMPHPSAPASAAPDATRVPAPVATAPRVVERPAAPAAPAPRHVAEQLTPVYMPSPRYPMSALRAHREGQVILSVTVTPEGDVTSVSVGHSSGDRDLDRAAEDAVRNWRFAGSDDRASRYTAELPVRFELTSRF